MKQKEILFFGQKCILVCDGKCNKAFGINHRPKISCSKDEDDYAYLADDEVLEAPDDPGTYEGGDGKPICRLAEEMNRWCARECERSSLFRLDEEIKIIDLSKRLYNISSKNKQ